MISAEMAKKLKDTGIVWQPGQGDRFALLDRDLDDRIFVINDMATIVELIQGTPAVTFHGSPEWALDYIYLAEVVWLPEESQLRQRLHEQLARAGEPIYDLMYVEDEFICRFEWCGEGVAVRARDAAEAYAAGLLHILTTGNRPG